MNHMTFFKSLKENTVASCYLFDGEEEYIKESALQALKNHLLPQGLETLNYSLMENPPVDELVAAVQTLPFMSEKRLVVVKNLNLLGVKGKKEEENFSDGCFLAFFVLLCLMTS